MAKYIASAVIILSILAVFIKEFVWYYFTNGFVNTTSMDILSLVIFI